MKDPKILAGGAVLLAALFWFYIKPNYVDAKPAPVYTEEQLAAAPRPTLTLGKNPEELILNLKAPATAPKFVKLSAALEFEDPEHKWVGAAGHALIAKNEEFSAEMEPELHRILDVVTSVVGSKSADEVSTPEGREQLKAELVEALNHELHGEKVEKIFFVTFITQ